MTFSIVLRDEQDNSFGVAVATRHFAVGALVPHLHCGVGALASQAMSNPYLGLRGLEHLAAGESVEVALQAVLSEDRQADFRQIHGVDAEGNSWAWTGTETQDWAGHECGENFSVAGNMLAGSKVVPACAQALRETQDWKLEERLLHALQAGEQAGGDKRGRQSAALLTIRQHPFPWCNLRVDDHKNPLPELERLLMEFRQPYYQNFIMQISAT